jgi:transposase
MPWMGVEKMKAHWRYLIARYGAWPVVWCAAGEANLPWYLAQGFPYDDRNQVHDWTTILRYIRATDPWHRLLTLHPTGIGPLTARHSTDDPSLLDYDMLQTPHGRQEAVPVTIKTVRQSYAASPVMPVIDGEASYEMLNDSLPTEWTRRMFWICLMNGAAGHTYGANGIWQCNRPGEPHGKSPHGGSYGVIPWNEAMRLPGSQQVGFGKKLFEQFAWQEFRPHPEWAAFGDTPLKTAVWIWYPEGNPAVDAPAATRFFRRSFVLPEGNKVERAFLRLSADDQFTARMNGVRLGGGEDWHSAKQFNDIARFLKPGTNDLAITAVNKPAPSANPAGLIAVLEIKFAGGVVHIDSDATWQCAKIETAEVWTNAMIAARYGQGPWGEIDGPSDSLNGPQSTSIPGVVRLIYAPRAEPVEVLNLDWRAAYAARWFDPVTGVTTLLGEIRCDDKGRWTCPPPAGLDHDWVLLLELKKSDRK